MTYNPEEDIKVSDLPEKTTDVVSDDKLLVIDSEDANILKQVDASKVWWWWSGTWDMLKSVYDKNNDWVVDDAEALWWFPASDYALSDNTQDKLESWVNIKTINWNSILWPWNIEIQGGTWTVDTEMSDTSTNAVQNRVIKGYVDTSAWSKQDTLVSGTNIKTINNTSLLWSGNIDIQGGWKLPVWIDITTSTLRYIFPTNVGWVSTLPRIWRIDYTAKTYNISEPENYKIYQWIWFINLTVDDLNITTNPSDWTFGCIYDWEYYSDWLFYVYYQQNSWYAWYKLVPTEVDSNWRVVLTYVELWTNSSSYVADLTIFRTQIW